MATCLVLLPPGFVARSLQIAADMRLSRAAPAGQILVTPDLLGMLPWYDLKHVKPKLNAAEQMRAAVRQWMEGVAKG